MQIKKSWNPIVMDHENLIIDADEGLSPNQMLERRLVTLDRPAMLMVNDQFWSRKDWNYPVPAGCTCRFVELPRGGGSGGSNPLKIIAMIVIMIVAIYMPGVLGLEGTLMGSMLSAGIMMGGSMLLNSMFGADSAAKNGTYGLPNSIYSISASANRLRIGEPYAEHFGRLICFPDLAQVSYVTIENNEQFLYFLGIIGIGEYEIEGVYIDKTPILDYSDTSYNILPPGNAPSLATHLVWTSAAATGQDLLTDWFTAVVSAPGTNTNYIEFDIMFGGGLIGYTETIQPYSVSVTVVAEARRIANTGIPLGEWLSLKTRTYTNASKDPLRYSEKCPVPDGVGRYEFRVKRTATASNDSKIINKAACTGLRAYGGLHPNYSGITMLEAKIRATDQLSGDVASRINCIVTRKLYQVTDTGFSDYLEPSRSIVDACAYIVTSENGGNQPDSGLMFDVLSGVKAELDALQQYFDWRFTSRCSVMDACSKIAKCGRSVPYMPSGFFALVRDDYQELPKLTYTDDDFDENSLMTTNAFRTADSSTCMRITYLNPDTWQTERISCYDEGGSELTPFDISLDGCSSRQQAYAIGMYLYRDDWLNRTTVEFTTGLKGHLPSLYNKIAIGAQSVDWGQSGKIAAIETGLIWLSEPVDFQDKASGQMFISSPDGTTAGPFTVLPTAYSHCVAGTIAGLNTIADDNIKATAYLFGPTTIDPFFIRIMGIQPQGQNKVRIFGTIINDDVYLDPGAAPELSSPIPADDPLGSISLMYKGINTGQNEFYVTWIGSALTYKIELNIGAGYSTLQDGYSSFNLTFLTAGTAITVRITPYVSGTLMTAYAQTRTYQVIPAPANLILISETSSGVTVGWDAVTGADSYVVTLWVEGVNEGGRDTILLTQDITTVEMSQLGGPWPEFTVHVAAILDGVMSQEAELIVTITPLTAPTSLALQQVLTNGVLLSWNAVTNATGYSVYVGAATGFDPETEGTLVYSGASPSCLAVVSVTHPYDHFFKVAAINGYYHEVADLVFSSSLEVSG